jgi:hypothetical protein
MRSREALRHLRRIAALTVRAMPVLAIRKIQHVANAAAMMFGLCALVAGLVLLAT